MLIKATLLTELPGKRKKKRERREGTKRKDKKDLKAGPPLEAILVIFGRRALIFFCLKALGKNEK